MGGFCALADWRPAVASCEQEAREGVTVRALALEGGRAPVEERVDRGEARRAQVIPEGPPPVADDRSEIAAGPGEDGGTTIPWTGASAPLGATAKEAEAVMRRVQHAGARRARRPLTAPARRAPGWGPGMGPRSHGRRRVRSLRRPVASSTLCDGPGHPVRAHRRAATRRRGREDTMSTWTKPVVAEQSANMEITAYYTSKLGAPARAGK